jgi:hypothetical protein
LPTIAHHPDWIQSPSLSSLLQPLGTLPALHAIALSRAESLLEVTPPPHIPLAGTNLRFYWETITLAFGNRVITTTFPALDYRRYDRVCNP